MKRFLPIAALLTLSASAARAQVGVGTTTPDPKAALEIKAADKGLLIPRLTASQRTAITSPPQGLLVYQTDGTASGGAQTGFWYYAGTGGWVFLDPAAGGALTLPFSGSVSTLGNAFQVTNTGLGAAIVAQASNSAAISGTNTGSGAALYGNNSGTGNGLVGQAASGTGVLAASASGPALAATKSGSQTGRLLSLVNANTGNDSTAVLVSTVGVQPALKGVDISGFGSGAGVVGITRSGYGVRGIGTASNGYGVQGESASSYGVRASSGSGIALYARSTSGLSLQVQKSGTDQGRLAEFTNANAGNDSTAVYLSTSGDRPALRAINTSAAAQAAIRGVKQAGTEGIGVEGVVTSGGGNAAGVLGQDKTGTSTGSGVIGLTASGYGVRGIASASGGFGVSGSATDSYGVIGGSQSGSGVYGTTNANATSVAGVEGVGNGGAAAVGVLGQTTTGYGVRGVATGAGGRGVVGVATTSYGVLGVSTDGAGVRGTSSTDDGVQGVSTSSYGVQGSSTNSSGVYGTTTTSSFSSAGVEGANTSGTGVLGTSTSGIGVQGTSQTGFGVRGTSSATNTSSAAGVLGLGGNGGIGVWGTSTGTGYGVRGETSGGGGQAVSGAAGGANSYGVLGLTSGDGGAGIYGLTSGAASAVRGQASGTGRAAYFGQISTTSTANALEVQNASLGRTALFNQSNASNTADAVTITQKGSGYSLLLNGSTPMLSLIDAAGGPRTTLSDQELRLGATNPASGSHTQINIEGTEIQGGGLPTFLPDGSAGPPAVLIARQTGTGIAIAASSGVATGRYAATFRGDIIATGSINGALKNFRIDHPLDPANQYLVHTSVESSELLNVYSGNAQLDARGQATVQLPAWFAALNTDVRYQLTPIGQAFTPYVLEKLRDGRFRIGGAPGAEVSWLLTAVRHDAFARQHPAVVEQPKEPENRGRYLHPEAFGQPTARGIGEVMAAPAARK